MRTTQDVDDDVVRNLARLLDVSGATRKQLAQFVEKDPSVITDRMKGMAVISVPDLRAFAEFFDIHPNVFLFTEDEFDQWLTPEMRRSLRQRVLIELTDGNVTSIHAARGSKRNNELTNAGSKTGSATANGVSPRIHEWAAAA